MRDRSIVRRGAHRIAGVAVLAVLASCANTPEWMSPNRSENPVGDGMTLGTPPVDNYLDELYRLTVGDPATQAEIYADAHAAAKLTPNPSTNLRYALVLATPGHPETDPQVAQSVLRDLLAQTELMTPTEISLATITLNAVEERIVLDTEAERLRATSSRQQSTEEAAVNDRLAAVEAENRRLRQELSDAEQKLEAITSIERSIREQDQ